MYVSHATYRCWPCFSLKKKEMGMRKEIFTTGNCFAQLLSRLVSFTFISFSSSSASPATRLPLTYRDLSWLRSKHDRMSLLRFFSRFRPALCINVNHRVSSCQCQCSRLVSQLADRNWQIISLVQYFVFFFSLQKFWFLALFKDEFKIF